MLKGANQYKKFKSGKHLTRMQAMKAQCYECNGLEEGREDCKGVSCPLYEYRLYPGVRSTFTKLEMAKNGTLSTKE